MSIDTQMFPGTSTGAANARTWLIDTLHQHGINGRTAADAAQVTAELAANAALHTRSAGDTFDVLLRIGPTRLRIEVTDNGSSTVPVARRTPPEDFENGRGLDLVAEFSTNWGTRSYPDQSRIVFAELTHDYPTQK